MDTYGLLSLIPPVVAIGLALVTRQVFISLLVGIWAGFVIIAGGNPVTGTFATLDGFVDVFQSHGNTRIILFTLIVGALIMLIQRSGGVQGFTDRLLRMLGQATDKAADRGQRKRVEILAALTGLVLFVESNISILTVGTLYRPVFDKLGIPREKLAYIADSTCAPSCILMPFNAWGAFIIGLIAAQGVANPTGTFMSAVLFNVYPMLAILIVFTVIITGRDFGPMAAAEARARDTGALLRPGATPMMDSDIIATDAKPGVTPKARNMLIPIAVLVLCMPAFLIMTGWADGNGKLLTALQSGSGSSSVLYAVSIAVLVAVLMYKASGTLGIRESADLVLKGMSGMVPLAVLMLLAFALGQLCKDLGTGAYVAEQIKGLISPALLPALIFLTACFIAFATGTSWGTFAIMIAVAVPLAQNFDSSVSLAIAAAVGGGIFGDHCSPISDTSVISSMATANDHIDHVRTQIPYALLGGGLTVLLYLLLGFAGL